MAMNTKPYNKFKGREIGCNAISMDYDFVAMTGRLWMPEGNCCDMSACISMFKAIDKEVIRIDTIAGRVRDVIYVKTGKGEWVADTRFCDKNVKIDA